ncbi:upstream stimulatory factor 2 isoform X2 [Monomorium pharaonis]|uniref:upstream stimulatory factor 2 isoform X2 n=1 Tax=Monomorium pharaonis TaxID=307658 RepID=UPI00063FCD71|nr:upstream stimulatory factor 2 isoform X2 [Monomorium pharaonis]
MTLKLLRTDENIASDETVGVVLEEAEIVDCDADIKLDDDDIRYHLYAVNRDDNAVEYKVMHVSNNDREGNELSVATPMNSTVQVLTAPLNAQLYVLSNGNEIITDSATAVVPNVTKLQIEGSQNILSAKKKRTDRRRVVHNEVERRRRDRISNWISKLAKLLADCELSSEQNLDKEENAKPNLEAQSKGGILARAFMYITELKETPDKLARSLSESAQLTEEVKNLQQIVTQLRDENSQLKAQILKQDCVIILDP